MLKILTETHKIVAKIVHNRIYDRYNINLDLNKMLWGSIAPDVLPYYKLHRHYFEESIDYISKEIAALIYYGRYSDIKNNENPIFVKFFSKKLGIISHYLCDYVCYPHAYRMTFIGNMKSHIKYESDLNQFVMSYKFKNEQYDNIINTDSISLFKNVDKKLKNRIKEYISSVVLEYKNSDKSFDTDMNFALGLCTEVSNFVIESVLNYKEDFEIQFV